MDISDRIFELIKSLKISQKEFSIATGIKESSLSDIKKKKYEPSASTLIKISEVYNVNLNWLLVGKGSMLIAQDGEQDISINDIAEYLKRLGSSEVEQELFRVLREAKLDEKRLEELVKVVRNLKK